MMKAEKLQAPCIATEPVWKFRGGLRFFSNSVKRVPKGVTWFTL